MPPLLHVFDISDPLEDSRRIFQMVIHRSRTGIGGTHDSPAFPIDLEADGADRFMRLRDSADSS